MRLFSKAMVLTGAFCMLASCGAKDYSSNKYIQGSTTYYQVTSMENYFTFRKDGTGKLQLDKYTYDLVFEMTSDTTASLGWNKAKMGSGTFSTNSNGYKEFSWSGKTYVCYSK